MSASQPDPAPAGAQFLAEIREQPLALARLLEHESEYERVADAARERGATTVRMVGHGSSDNAASYGVYAFGLLPRWTAFRDSITLTVHYGTGLDMAGCTVIGLSQSGRTPDVVQYVERARRGGAFTIGLTNDADSELAGVAEAVLPLAAGPERAIAATKTYLNQVAALGLLAAHAAGRGREFADGIRVVIDQLGVLIPALEERVREVAVPFAFTGRMFVIGRGVEFGTAREIALKLLETCRIAAEPSRRPVSLTDPSPPSIRCFRCGRSRPTTRPCRRCSRPPPACARPGPPWSPAAARPRPSPTPTTSCPCPSRPWRCSRRSCRRRRASFSRGRSRRRKDSTPTVRGGSRR